MHTTSVKMRIHDLTLDQLRRFTDAAGEASLAALSTHEGAEPKRPGRATPHIYSGWIGFAQGIVGFLDLAVDLDGLAARHRQRVEEGRVRDDTKFLPLGMWGVGRKAVLGRLAGRRPDIDAEDIRGEFEKGYAGRLVIGGRPAIKVRF